MSPQERMAKLLSKQNPFTVVAKCIDDTLPPFHVDNWVEKGEVYEVGGMGEESLQNQAAIVIFKDGVHVKPSETIDVFKASRFKIYAFGNN